MWFFAIEKLIEESQVSSYLLFSKVLLNVEVF